MAAQRNGEDRIHHILRIMNNRSTLITNGDPNVVFGSSLFLQMMHGHGEVSTRTIENQTRRVDKEVWSKNKRKKVKKDESKAPRHVSTASQQKCGPLEGRAQ